MLSDMFYNSLINSKKTPVRFLARLRESDQRTVLGRTLAALRLHCKVDDNIMLSATLVKKYLVYKDVPEDEAWRIQSRTFEVQRRIARSTRVHLR
jgi:hypothetical protein